MVASCASNRACGCCSLRHTSRRLQPAALTRLHYTQEAVPLPQREVRDLQRLGHQVRQAVHLRSVPRQRHAGESHRHDLSLVCAVYRVLIDIAASSCVMPPGLYANCTLHVKAETIIQHMHCSAIFMMIYRGWCCHPDMQTSHPTVLQSAYRTTPEARAPSSQLVA